jgi:hypothetical protein
LKAGIYETEVGVFERSVQIQILKPKGRRNIFLYTCTFLSSRVTGDTPNEALKSKLLNASLL